MFVPSAPRLNLNPAAVRVLGISFLMFLWCPGLKVVRVLHPCVTTLVTCSGHGVDNVLAIAWAMPVSADPPMVAVSISPRRYSYGLIEETGEFVVNVVSTDMLDAVWKCGTTSGCRVDKFSLTGLEKTPSEVVKPPRIKGALASLECRVVDRIETGDHVLFVGKIVAYYVDEEAFDVMRGVWRLEKADILMHLGGRLFTRPRELVRKS